MSCVGLLPRRCRALLSPPLEMYLSSWEAAQHDTISLARHNPNIISLLCDDNLLLSWPCTECQFSRGHGPRNWCCVQSWKPNVENQVFWRVTSPSKMCPPDSRLSDRTFSKIHLIPTFKKFPLRKTINWQATKSFLHWNLLSRYYYNKDADDKITSVTIRSPSDWSYKQSPFHSQT